MTVPEVKESPNKASKLIHAETNKIIIMVFLKFVSVIFKLKNTLWKHAYSNILKTSPPKAQSFRIKILIIFIFLRKT